MNLFKSKSIQLFGAYALVGLTIIISALIINNFSLISYRVFEYAITLNNDPDPYYNFLLGLLCFVSLSFMVALFNNKDYLYLWIIKGGVTLFILLGYEYAYGIDSYMYYALGVFAPEGITYNGTSTDNIIFLTNILTNFVGNSYYSLKVIYSFFSFIGLVFLYKSYLLIIDINKINSSIQKQFMYILFLFPSILFWSSTLGKDSLNLFFVGIFIYNLLKILNRFNIWNVIFILLVIIGICLLHYGLVVQNMGAIFCGSFQITFGIIK